MFIQRPLYIYHDNNIFMSWFRCCVQIVSSMLAEIETRWVKTLVNLHQTNLTRCISSEAEIVFWSMRDLYLWFYFVLFASNCKGRNGYQPRLPIQRKQCNSNISSCCHRVKYRTFACETNITDIHVTYGS